MVRLDLGNVVLAGVDFKDLRAISLHWQVDGGWITVDFDERNAMIRRQLAEKMELTVGRTINVINRDRDFKTQFRVKRVIDTGEAEDEQIFVNMSLAREIFDAPDRIDLALLSVVAQGAEANALAKRINAEFPDVEAKPIGAITSLFIDNLVVDKKGIIRVRLFGEVRQSTLEEKIAPLL